MQSVSSTFLDLANGQVRPITYGVRVAWQREIDDSTTFFVLDQSILDGTDVLKPDNDDPLQSWAFYKYIPMTQRVTSFEYSREISFPYSVTAAIADFTLDNHDGAFNTGSGSYLANWMLPSRPVRLNAGLGSDSLQQFVGLTEDMPEIDDSTKEVRFHAVDFLSRIFELKTPSIVSMQDVTTDQVLDVLFQAAGLSPSEYSLAKGSNKIAFVYYEAGTTIGDIVKSLMEAEMGNLFMDEAGIIRFTPRVVLGQHSIWEFDDNSIVSIKSLDANNIINSVIIKASIRAVQVKQPIWTLADVSSDDYVIPANSTKSVFITLSDPTISVTTPTAGLSTTDSYFIAQDLSGVTVGSVTIDSTALFVDTYLITFRNSNAFDVRVFESTIWGEPAKVVDTINYSKKDTDSIAKYEERVFEIDNDFIQSIDACDTLALTILHTYSEKDGDLQIEVKGNPALQLNDIVTVDRPSFAGTYQVTKIDVKIIGGKYEQILNISRYTPTPWFQLDVSVLDGPDVLTV